MADTQVPQPQAKIIAMNRRSLLWVIIIGALVGLLFWGGALLFERVILEPVFCGSVENGNICDSKTPISLGVGLVVAAFIGMLGLIRANVYRPLLITIAVVASLWGLGELLSRFDWTIGLAWSAGLFALAYLLFVWISRLRSFPAALFITIVAVIVLRLIPTL